MFRWIWGKKWSELEKDEKLLVIVIVVVCAVYLTLAPYIH